MKCQKHLLPHILFWDARFQDRLLVLDMHACKIRCPLGGLKYSTMSTLMQEQESPFTTKMIFHTKESDRGQKIPCAVVCVPAKL